MAQIRRRRKKTSTLKKVLFLGSAIVTIQLVIMLSLKSGQTDAISLKDYMLKLSGTNTADRNRQIMAIQISVSDFKIRNNKLPETLEELVPEYFDQVPIDPETSEAFIYAIVDDYYVLGTAAQKIQQAVKVGAGEIQPGSVEELAVLLNTLNFDNNASSTIYDFIGKKDPFLPFDFSPKQKPITGENPIEQHSYSELRLTAILLGFNEPKAIIETPDGKGYTVTLEDKIGNLGGVIKKIEPDKIVILESLIDFTGERKVRLIEIALYKAKKEEN